MFATLQRRHLELRRRRFARFTRDMAIDALAVA
jgi:hypothetical protein